MKLTAACLSDGSAGTNNNPYERYAEARPHHPAPSCPADLLAGREPTYRGRFLPLLPRAKRARILDVGCGYGEFLYFLQQGGYTRTCGIDLDPRHIDVGSSLGVRNLQVADAWDFLPVTGEFDFISALDVLEHIPRDRVLDLLRAVRQALSPGGRFLCQVPNLAAFHTPLFFMDFTHQAAFTAPSLKQALELAQFSDVEIHSMGPVAHGLRSATRSLLWKAVSATLRSIQTIEGGPRDRLCSIFTSSICATAEKGDRETRRL
jgi:SAM-dependent methyltransferase